MSEEEVVREVVLEDQAVVLHSMVVVEVEAVSDCCQLPAVKEVVEDLEEDSARLQIFQSKYLVKI